MTGTGEWPLEAICLGETMAMLAPALAEPLQTASSLVVRAAGAESNVAMYLASLGHRVAWASRLGDDPLGRRVLQEVARTGVDVSLVEMAPDAPTGVMFKDPGAGERRVYYYRRGSAASAMGADLAGAVLAAPPRLAHLSGVTPALSEQCSTLVGALLDGLNAVGTTTSFDVNYRPALWPSEEAGPALLALARKADIVFTGLDEAQQLWGVAGAAELRRLLGRPGTVVVKNGAEGATSFVGENQVHVPVPRAEVRDAVGAGDAFAAGWLSGWLRSLPESKRLRLGHLVAGCALSGTADYVPLPGRPWFASWLETSEEQWSDRQWDGPGAVPPTWYLGTQGP